MWIFFRPKLEPDSEVQRILGCLEQYVEGTGTLDLWNARVRLHAIVGA